MNIKPANLWATLLVWLVATSPASAIDYSGMCQGTVPAAGSPHRLVGACNVPSGQMFTLDPGAVLDGQRNSLSVLGDLVIDQATLNDVFVSLSGGTIDADGASFGGDDGQMSFSNGASGTVANSTFGGVRCLTISGSSPSILNNTFTDLSQAICVGGAAQPTIQGNQITVTSNGMRFTSPAAGTVSGNTIGFSGVSGSRVGIFVQADASPSITGNSILDDVGRKDTGIRLTINNESAVQVTGNDICATGDDVPIDLGVDYFADGSTALVMGNDFSCDVDSVFLHGTLSESGTVRPVEGHTSFALSSPVSVAGGQTLTIPSSYAIAGGRNGFSVSGELIADGVTLDDVFLSIAGGVLNADGASFGGGDGQLSFSNGASGTMVNCTYSGPRCLTITGSSPSILNSTFTDLAQAICVNGVAQPTIQGNQITATSSAMRFTGPAAGTVSGNTIGFSGTSSSRTGVFVQQDASPSITGNTILDDAERTDTGIHLSINKDSAVQVTGNDICATGDDKPIDLGIDYFANSSTALVMGNDFSCDLDSVYLRGTLSESGELRPVEGNTSFFMSSVVTIAAGQTLTIPSSYVIDGGRQSITVNGELIADGVTIDNVFFGINGGVFNADGSSFGGDDGQISFTADASGTIANGTYGGLRCLSINNSSPTLEGNVFADQISAICVGGNLSPTPSRPSIRANTFIGADQALTFDGDSAATLEENRFESNMTAIRVRSSEPSQLAGNVFVDNGRSVGLDTEAALLAAFPQGLADNDFVGPGHANAVGLPAQFSAALTLGPQPVHYEIFSMSLGDGAELRFAAGAVVHVVANGGFFVAAGAELALAGTASEPVILTAEDAKGAGRWRGIMANGGLIDVENCIVDFGGIGIEMNGGSLAMRDCNVSDHRTYGVLVRNGGSASILRSALLSNGQDGVRVDLAAGAPGSVQIAASSIFGNGGLGVNQVRDTFTIPAERVYWGHDSGPSDLSQDQGGLYNPAGRGQPVSDRVDYDPWVRIGPSQAGFITPISGMDQSGPVGSILPAPVVVRIDSVLGSPLPDIDVIFSVVDGDGSVVEDQPRVTDAMGRASAMVQLGLTPGPVRIAVTARDVASPFATFMGEADGPCLIEMKSRPLRWRLFADRPGQRGDVDGDGHVDNADAVALLGELDESSGLPRRRRAADVNGDRRLDAGDVRALLGVQIGVVGGRAPAEERLRRRQARRERGVRGGRVEMVLPQDPVSPGDIVEVPVFLRDGDRNLASYALSVYFSRDALRFVEVLGGTMPPFDAAPVTNLAETERGRIHLAAAVAPGTETPGRYSVARLRFQVTGAPGDRARIMIVQQRGGRVVDPADPRRLFLRSRARGHLVIAE
jgi:hypothetical protein